jgi:LPXTG-motif cell wall-anchored protein
MGKRPLIWVSLFALLIGVPALVHARIGIPFFKHHHKAVSQSTQRPSALARTEPSATSPYRSGWDTGYKSGYEGGQADHSKGSKFDRDDAPGYKSGHSFCESLEGKAEHQCRKGYRVGFKLGYEDGYSGLVSRLITNEESTTSQAAVTPAEQAPAEPETSSNQPEVQSQPEQPSTAMEETPAQQPSSGETAQAQNQPRALPRTGSKLPMFGLIGLMAIGLSLLSRFFRKISQT